MRKTLHIKNGVSIYGDTGTHASRLFHAIRIVRNRFFWDAAAQGCMAALSGEPRKNNPFQNIPHVNRFDWDRGYDAGSRIAQKSSIV